MNIIDFQMDIQEAIAVPRVSFVEPDTIAVEEGIGSAVRRGLESRGHKVHIIKRPGGLGNAHGLMVEYDEQGRPLRFKGASDPRGNGLAQGF